MYIYMYIYPHPLSHTIAKQVKYTASRPNTTSITVTIQPFPGSRNCSCPPYMHEITQQPHSMLYSKAPHHRFHQMFTVFDLQTLSHFPESSSHRPHNPRLIETSRLRILSLPCFGTAHEMKHLVTARLGPSDNSTLISVRHQNPCPEMRKFPHEGF